MGRLQQHLDAVAEQVREAVATTVRPTAAEVIGESAALIGTFIFRSWLLLITWALVKLLRQRSLNIA